MEELENQELIKTLDNNQKTKTMKTNLIGISGKIGSGKDTVGSILKYLEVAKHPSGEDYNNWIHRGGFSKEIPTYQIKKFADKLKDIACLLIGCTREQLEDREFKEKPISPEWMKWFTEDGLPPKNNNAGVGEVLTPRKLLQLLGTECGRQIIHPNIWVNALFANYKSVTPSENRYTGVVHCGPAGWIGTCDTCKEKIDRYTWKGVTTCDQCREKPVFPNWIITDVRFPNEAQAIKDRANSLLIRVERPNFVSESNHESETALDNYEGFDEVIINDGSIEDLIEKVRAIWEKYS